MNSEHRDSSCFGFRLFDGDGKSIFPPDGPPFACFDMKQWPGNWIMCDKVPDAHLRIIDPGLTLLLDEQFKVSDEVLAQLVWEIQRGGAIDFRTQRGGDEALIKNIRQFFDGGHA